MKLVRVDVVEVVVDVVEVDISNASPSSEQIKVLFGAHTRNCSFLNLATAVNLPLSTSHG